jgi:hypothetical protein
MLRASYKHENEDVLNFRQTDLARDELNCLEGSQEPTDHYRVHGFGPAGHDESHHGDD